MGVDVAVASGVGEGVEVGVLVGSGVSVGVGDGDGVDVGAPVGVGVGVGVGTSPQGPVIILLRALLVGIPALASTIKCPFPPLAGRIDRRQVPGIDSIQ